MLEVGKDRAKEKGLHESTGLFILSAVTHTSFFLDPSISWIVGDAEKLPVENNSVDAYTIAFGIRNCTNVDQVLKEAYRVLKPGGRFLCLEFSQVETFGFKNWPLQSLYDAYSFYVIPQIGSIVAS